VRDPARHHDARDGWGGVREEQLRDPELAGIPVVLISAHRDVAEKAKTLKAAAYLVKPLKLKELLALTDEYC
jgi:two-component system, chemotaxis family, chemotaxis protein CheY